MAILLHGLLLVMLSKPEPILDMGAGSPKSLALSLSTLSFVSQARAMAHPVPETRPQVEVEPPTPSPKKAPPKIVKQHAVPVDAVTRSVSPVDNDKASTQQNVAEQVEEQVAEQKTDHLPEQRLAEVTEQTLEVDEALDETADETMSEPTDQVGQNDRHSQGSNAAEVVSVHQNITGIKHEIVTRPAFKSPPTPPVYPRLARKRGQEGTVWLDIWLDELGEQTHLQVHQSSGNAQFDHAALAAVAQWHFVPRNIDGINIASRVRIPINFQLK